jgi:mono/diheme cytochrome c family protein
MNKREWLRSAALVGFLLIQMPMTVAAQAEQTQHEVLAGNAVRGEALFAGTTAFTGGGAPCLACHGVAGAGLGMASGANYGPDLTSMLENFGAEGVAGVLGDLTMFTSMTPIYAERPLTIQEQADVGAFLAQVADRPVFAAEGRLYGHVATGLLALLGVLVLFGWGRLKGVRQPLIDSARERKGGPR